MKVNENTGEVLEVSKFASAYCNPYGFKSQDLSREEEEVFEEVAPFAMDPETGKLLNPSSVPMLISKGKVNVQERIQSFADDVDIYKILDRVAAGDSSMLRTNLQYGDISFMPNDLNGYALFVNNHFKALDDMNPELAKLVIDKEVTPEQIEAKAKEIYDSRVAEFEASNNSKKEGTE